MSGGSLAKKRAPAYIVGTAGDPRVAGYQAARTRAGLAPAALLDYRDLIADPQRAAARLRAPARVRIESPGRDPQVLAGLLAAQAGEVAAAQAPWFDVRPWRELDGWTCLQGIRSDRAAAPE